MFVRQLPDGCNLSCMTTDGDPAGQRGPADPAAVAERLFHDVTGGWSFTVYLGEGLGPYRAPDRDGRATSSELAGRTGTAER